MELLSKLKRVQCPVNKKENRSKVVFPGNDQDDEVSGIFPSKSSLNGPGVATSELLKHVPARIKSGSIVGKNLKTEPDYKNFKAGFAWIHANRAELKSKGWTSPALFRRSRYTFPMGPWGLAWLPDWNRPGQTIQILKNGQVSFTYESGNRTITQVVSLGKQGAQK